MVNSNTTKALKAAKDLYMSNDFDSAIDTIREAKSDFDPGLFHYNLGSLYLKKGDLGPARLHLEKAKKNGFDLPMLWNNLNYIKEQSFIFDPVKSSSIKEKVVGTTLDVPIAYFSIFLLVWIIAVLSGLKVKKLKRIKVVALLLILGSVPLLSRIYVEQKYQFAVTIEGTLVHEGPSSAYPDYGQVNAGSRLIVGRSYEDWYYVISPQESAGWVNRQTLGFL